jgi:hypothetical protein
MSEGSGPEQRNTELSGIKSSNETDLRAIFEVLISRAEVAIDRAHEAREENIRMQVQLAKMIGRLEDVLNER